MRKVLLEVCVDDAEGLAAAIAGGADRIELCSSLELGGLTPSPGLIQLAATAAIPVYAMIRPRAGDFIFTPREADQMLHEIDAIHTAGLAGVVLGASREDGRLDEAMLQGLTHHAAGLGTTLHRAFDLVPVLGEATETAIGLGFERILTSGRAPTSAQGLDDLAATIEAASGRISIMPGSGVNSGNAAQILSRLAVTEIHASGSATINDVNKHAARLGFETGLRRKTDARIVTALKTLLETL
ncbi:MAG: copper homeostasis protein CutC [Phyllobacterium sp.]